MRKYFCFLVIIFVCKLSFAQTIAKDVPLHLGAGFAIGAVGGYTAHQLFDGDPYWYWAGAVGSSFAAGIVKESIDKSEYGIWDNSDVLYTTLGGIASGFILDLFLKKSGKRTKYRSCKCYVLKYDHTGEISPVTYTITASSSRDIGASLQAQRVIQNMR